jgi:hypothetical protein
VEKDSKLEQRAAESGSKGTHSVKFLILGRLVIAHCALNLSRSHHLSRTHHCRVILLRADLFVFLFTHRPSP